MPLSVRPALGLLFWLATGVASAGPVTVERVVYLMGTRATLVVEADDRARAAEHLETLLRSLERTEGELSTWRDDSVLGRLNRQPVGRPFTPSPFVCRLWPALVYWHRETGGAFDPSIGAWGDAWGLRDGGRQPSPRDRRAAAARTGLDLVRFDGDGCLLTRTATVTLDAGGFGKGAALGRLPRPEAGDAWMVDLGGQVAVASAGAGRRWRVALAHPAARDVPVLEVVLTDGALATSGASERTVEVGGRRLAHIIDPRSGEPLTRPESVTVWHADPLVADILSTALYVMGPDAGLRYADARRIAAVYLAPDAGAPGVRVQPSRAFRHRFGVRERLPTPADPLAPAHR